MEEDSVLAGVDQVKSETLKCLEMKHHMHNLAQRKQKTVNVRVWKCTTGT